MSSIFKQGNWYKGNLHTHSNISDGKLSPCELVEMYKADGYDFLAITDHCIYGFHDEFNSDDFIVLPGVELNTPGVGNHQHRDHHVVGIGIPGKNSFSHGERFVPPDMDPQLTVDALTSRGNIAIYAHPHWSHCRMDVVKGLKGLTGVEIYNHMCQVGGVGYSEYVYDELLWDGSEIYCFATDDTHGGYTDSRGGYIVVKAEKLSHEAIVDSIISGDFYASSGAVIHDIVRDGDKVTVKCSPCCKIVYEGDNFPGCAVNGENGEDTLTEHTFTLVPYSKYFRFTVIDTKGHKAWTHGYKV